MSYNPFVSLQWMVDGKTVAGTPTRDSDALPTREEALRLYTQGSAWFTHDEHKRGTLARGRFADLAVLTKDYMAVPTTRSAASSRCSRWSAAASSMPSGTFQTLEERR